VEEIERSCELDISQGESPSIGYSKSRGREKREGNNRWIRTWDRVSEPHEKRPENLTMGITRLRVEKSLGEKSAS
jgi:hypothetical protein